MVLVLNKYLPDELICKVLYYWLRTSDAPMTLRHCSAKYFDTQHYLNGKLARCAIRKLNKIYPDLEETIRNYKVYVEEYDDTTTIAYELPIKKRTSDCYFSVHKTLSCQHDNYYLVDYKLIEMTLILSDTKDYWLFDHVRHIDMKCKMCDKVNKLSLSTDDHLEFKFREQNNKGFLPSEVLRRHFDDMTVREVYNEM